MVLNVLQPPLVIFRKTLYLSFILFDEIKEIKVNVHFDHADLEILFHNKYLIY